MSAPSSQVLRVPLLDAAAGPALQAIHARSARRDLPNRMARARRYTMGIRDFIAKQFIDVIQWTEPEAGILAYRYPMEGMEIQNGAALTVRESQVALFVDQGKVADLF